jgi:hypothetical protein
VDIYIYIYISDLSPLLLIYKI